VSEIAHTELVDETAHFFAPVSADIFTELLGQYQSMRKRIEAIGNMIDVENESALEYFLSGNSDDSGHFRPSVKKLFEVSGAVASLNSAYWSKTLALTDVLDMMPQKRRDEWHKTIREMTAPDFVEETVRPTITEMMNMRAQFLAERVDGIFRGLSGDHVTNAPEGFGKRMIIARVLNAYDSADTSTCGLINDLRCVVAKFMGRKEPGWHATSDLIPILRRRWGQWVTLDGGSMKIKLHRKGTAHMEVHPDMSWRLNAILASMYPRAIPAEFRQKPKKQIKEFELIGRPLPFNVLALLGGMRIATRIVGNGYPTKYVNIENARKFDSGRHVGGVEEATKVLESIGAVLMERGSNPYFQFDYDPTEVLDDIVASGCIPDKQSHQYYATPEKLARIAVEWAYIGDDDQCLEPSAGQGGIAQFMPQDRTTCVEISELHCTILKAKGVNVVNADFLPWAITAGRYDRIILNPPFEGGRARLHTEYAIGLLKPGGVVVSILPASNKGKDFDGVECEWSTIYENEFAGTGVNVVILKATKCDA
jgi:hypothetical protein